MRSRTAHLIMMSLTCVAVAIAGVLMGASTAVVAATVAMLGVVALLTLPRRG